MNDQDLGEALRSPSEDTVLAAFDRHYTAMHWLARAVVGDDERATEVVLDTWAGALRAARGGGARPPYRAWLFDRLRDRSIMVARGRAPETGPSEAGSGPDRQGEFFPDGHRWEGHWVEFPESWSDRVAVLGSPAGRGLLAAVIDRLAPRQRALLILRDLDGWSADEAGALLDLPAETQREELHRARLAVAGAVDEALAKDSL
jgi:RNA polymerase sigma-70 factor (ECF subfamily)